MLCVETAEMLRPDEAWLGNGAFTKVGRVCLTLAGVYFSVQRDMRRESAE